MPFMILFCVERVMVSWGIRNTIIYESIYLRDIEITGSIHHQTSQLAQQPTNHHVIHHQPTNSESIGTNPEKLP